MKKKFRILTVLTALAILKNLRVFVSYRAPFITPIGKVY